MRQKVIVIGAGVIGAAAAYQMSARGADVLVIDAGHAQATDASFGWINASFFETRAYFDLRVAGIAAYKRLQDRLDIPINFCGTLAWEFSGAELDAQFQTLAGAGYAAHVLERDEIAAMEPDLGALPERALYFSEEAAVEPSGLAQCLIEGSGAHVLRGVAAKGFVTMGGRVTGVRTQAGDFAADDVLVAAGTGSAPLLKQVGVHLPLLNRPALVLTTRPVDVRLYHVLATDFGEVRQLPNGALITPAAIGHQGDTSEELAHPEAAAEASMARMRALFPGVEMGVSEMHLTHRPVPLDGFPVVGEALPGLYVAVMHSGITLAALMGELIAAEVLDGRAETALQDFRPARFA